MDGAEGFVFQPGGRFGGLGIPLGEGRNNPYPKRGRKLISVASYEGLSYKQTVHVDFDDPVMVESETARIRGLCTRSTMMITIRRDAITNAGTLRALC